ncbi:hypothetical protein ABE459_25030 [Pseudomonas sp. TWI923]|uniref:hypothetical protein n=1 Tax=Pseudomonas sp. TWI923 TaxID=3136794 RepID=UPI00320915E6
MTGAGAQVSVQRSARQGDRHLETWFERIQRHMRAKRHHIDGISGQQMDPPFHRHAHFDPVVDVVARACVQLGAGKPVAAKMMQQGRVGYLDLAFQAVRRFTPCELAQQRLQHAVVDQLDRQRDDHVPAKHVGIFGAGHPCLDHLGNRSIHVCYLVHG